MTAMLTILTVIVFLLLHPLFTGLVACAVILSLLVWGYYTVTRDVPQPGGRK